MSVVDTQGIGFAKLLTYASPRYVFDLSGTFVLAVTGLVAFLDVRIYYRSK